ncbi:MAG: HK97 family phage prohead protease [Gluconacetobacter liquefaciens]
MEVCAVPFEFKLAAGDTGAAGTVEGYGAIFGNTDAHGDVISPGAFAASLAERKAQGRALPMHVMHGVFGGDGVPAGVWHDVSEDSRGLHVKGKISGVNTDAGRLLYERVKDGALGGLSIGYSVPEGGAAKANQPGARRQIKQANLFEVSLVDDPSNALARVTELKSRVGWKATSAPGMAIEAVAKAIALHQAVLGGGDAPTAQERADLLEHMQAAHEALTGQRMPIEGKSLLADLSGILGEWGHARAYPSDLISFDLAAFKAMSMSSSDASAFVEAMRSAMKSMNDGMDKAGMSGPPDRAFAAMMIPHHQGAIDMARAEIEHGNDPAMLALAHAIVSSQSAEIATMRSFLAK